MSDDLAPRWESEYPPAALQHVREAPASQSTIVEIERAVAEVQSAIIVAQKVRRDPGVYWPEMKAACQRLGLAERAFYDVRNRGKGPTVHLARALAALYGNIQFGVHELRRDDERGESEIEAFAWDVQTNVRSTRRFIVPHAIMKGGNRERIVDLQGIYLNNQNVGARALRMCIFSVLPADYADEAQLIARETLEKGEGVPLDQRVATMITRFNELGVKVGDLETKIGKRRASWTPADLAQMSIIFSSIKRGETTRDDEFQQRIEMGDLSGQSQGDTHMPSAEGAMFPEATT